MHFYFSWASHVIQVSGAPRCVRHGAGGRTGIVPLWPWPSPLTSARMHLSFSASLIYHGLPLPFLPSFLRSPTPPRLLPTLFQPILAFGGRKRPLVVTLTLDLTYLSHLICQYYPSLPSTRSPYLFSSPPHHLSQFLPFAAFQGDVVKNMIWTIHPPTFFFH